MRLGSLREMNKWKFKELEPSSRIIRQGLWIPTKEIKKNEKKMKKKKKSGCNKGIKLMSCYQEATLENNKTEFIRKVPTLRIK